MSTTEKRFRVGVGIQFPDGTTVDTATGLVGATGPQGPQGEIGGTGATGVQGLTGATGVQGLTGATGSTGPQGNAGATGATGPQGDQGQTGLDGATGATGPMGPAGANGTSVVIIGSEAGPVDSVYLSTEYPSAVAGNGIIDESTGHLWVFGGSTWSDVGQVKGDQGLQGATGATGPQGSTGNDGATGATGPQGDPGTFPSPMNSTADANLDVVLTTGGLPYTSDYGVYVNPGNGKLFARGFLAAETETPGDGGGYGFTADGGQDTGMYSAGDGNLQFFNNNVLTANVTQNNWQFEQDVITDGIVSTANSTLKLQSTNDSGSESRLRVRSNGQVDIRTNDGTDGYKYWSFDNNGFTFPDTTVQTTAFTGTGDIRFSGSWIKNVDSGNIYISPQDGQTWLNLPSDSQAPTDTVRLANALAGGVQIQSSSNYWNFNSDGTTTLPGYILPAAAGDTGKVLVSAGTGNALVWANRNPFDQVVDTTADVTFNSVTVGSTAGKANIQNYVTASYSGDTPVAIAGFTSGDYNGAKYLIQVIEDTGMGKQSHTTEMIVNTVNGDVYETEYGITSSGALLGEFNNINDSGSITLMFTPAAALVNATITVYCTFI